MNDMIPQMQQERQIPRYRLSGRLVGGILGSVSLLRTRSFAHDAQMALGGLSPGLEVRGVEHIPPQGPCLVACNHYSRPGFAAWWLVFAITATVAAHRAPGVEREIRWVMTAAWTFPGSQWRRRVLTPVTRWAFARVAKTYGFVTMPPMPPHPDEVEARAEAVLRTVRLARRAAQDGGMVGLAPEGRDVPEGLGEPSEGVGRFVALLVNAGLPILPVAVTERGGRLWVFFGPVYKPEIPGNQTERDRSVARQVMDSIAHLLAENQTC